MKKSISILLAAVLLLVSVPTIAEAATKVKAKSVSLDQKEAYMCVDDTLQLEATMQPAESNDSLTWSTSNKKVATVSKKGLVTAKASGKAIITVKTGSKKTAKCTVVVREGLSRADVLELIKGSTLTEDEIVNYVLGNASVKEMIDKEVAEKSITEEKVKELIKANTATLTEDKVKEIIAANTIGEDKVKELVNAGKPTEDDVKKLVGDTTATKEYVDGKVMTDDKVKTLISENTLSEDDVKGLIAGNNTTQAGVIDFKDGDEVFLMNGFELPHTFECADGSKVTVTKAVMKKQHYDEFKMITPRQHEWFVPNLLTLELDGYFEGTDSIKGHEIQIIMGTSQLGIFSDTSFRMGISNSYDGTVDHEVTETADKNFHFTMTNYYRNGNYDLYAFWISKVPDFIDEEE